MRRMLGFNSLYLLAFGAFVVGTGVLALSSWLGPPKQEERAADQTTLWHGRQIPFTSSPYWQQFGRDCRHTARSDLCGAQNAKLKWLYTGTDDMQASPAISEYSNVAACSGGYYPYYLYMINSSGQALWSYAFWSIAPKSPAFSSDSLRTYIAADDGLYAINSAGGLDWAYYLPGSSYTDPVVGPDGTIYIGSGSLLSAIGSSGSLVWTYWVPGQSSIACTPAVTDAGTVFFSSARGFLFSVQSGGTLSWSYDVGSVVRSAPAIAQDGTVYFGCDANKAFALEPDGSLDWSFSTGGQIVASPALARDGSVLFGCMDGRLLRIRSDGSLCWSFQASSAIQSSPAIDADGSIYFGTDGGTFYALNSFGLLKYSYTALDDIVSSPAIGPYETVVFGSDDNKVYCLESLPKLSEGLVDPTAGTDGDTYVFSVHYYSPARRAPWVISVTIDGSDTLQLSLDSGKSWDGIYTATTGLAQGDHTFRFTACDNRAGPNVYLPPSGSFSGPIVDNDGDRYEPDDSCAEAEAGNRTITPNGAAQSRTFLDSDEDWVMLEAEKGTCYIASTFHLSHDCDTILSLYSPGCDEELASDDDSGFGKASILCWTCPETDTYFLLVRPKDSASAGAYKLAVRTAHWPMFKHGPTGRGKTPVVACPGPSLAWEKGDIGHRSAPAVGADGRIYSRDSAGSLFALTPDGQVVWSYPADMPQFSAVAVATYGTIYVPSDSDKLLALDLGGGLLWSFGTGATGAGNLGSPIVGPSGDVYLGSSDHCLYALSRNGSLIWSFDSRCPILGSPSIGAQGRLFFGNTCGFLFSLASDGSFVWFKDLAESISSSPIVDSQGNVAVVTDEGTVYSFDPDGDLRWSYAVGQSTSGSPALGPQDTIYVPVPGTELLALSSAGDLLWTFPADVADHTTPAVSGNGLIYIGADGLKAITTDGSLGWSYHISGAAESSPAIGPDGTVYIGMDYSLFAFREEEVSLTDGSVSPQVGKTSTTFAYEVHYQSTLPPSKIEVVIDGTGHDMTFHSGQENNGLYWYRTSSLSEGEHSFHFYAETSTGKEGRAPETGEYDGPIADDTPPTSQTDSPQYCTAGDVQVDFSSSDNLSGIDLVTLYYSFEGGAWTEFHTTSESTGTGWMSPVSGDGRYGFCSRAADNAGNWEDFPASADTTTVYDSARPTSTCSSPAFYAQSPIPVEFDASDETSGIASVALWFKKDGGSWTFYDSKGGQNQGTFGFVPNGEGIYAFYTIAKDKAQNEEQPPSQPDCTTTYDTTRPGSQCQAPQYANSSPVSVTFQSADEGGSGVAKVELYWQFEDGQFALFDTKYASAGTFSFGAFTDSGAYRFYTVAYDNAGNAEAPPDSPDAETIYDLGRPVSSCQSPEWVTGGTITVEYSAEDDVSGVARVELYSRQPGAGWTLCDVATDSTAGVFAFTASGDGTYEFRTSSRDRAGNQEEWSDAPDSTTVYDTRRPSSACSSPGYSSGATIAVSFWAADEQSGIANVALWYRFGGGQWKASGLSSSATAGTFDFAPPDGDGSYDFYTIATDDAGWVEQAPAGPDCSTVYDTQTPTSYCFCDDYSTSAITIVHFVATDTTSGIASVDLYYAEGSAGFALWQESTAGTVGSFEFVAPNEGRYRFYTVANDRAGNTEAPPSGWDAESVYDASAPTAVCEAPALASGSSIDIGFETEDNLSGIDQVLLFHRFGSAEWVASAATTASAGVFSFVPAWGDGEYRFSLGAQDRAGNVLQPGYATCSTLYDTTAPLSSCWADNFVTIASVAVGFEASDTGSGVERVDLWCRYEGGSWRFTGQSASGTTGSFKFVPGDGDGLYDLSSQARDRAGNREQFSGIPDCSVVVDTSPPSLLWGSVAPAAGTPQTEYTYTVLFSDADGRAPSASTVVIDGEAFTMTLASGQPASGVYSFSTTLAAGVHNYYFYFEDAYGLGVRLPEQGTLSGPEVNTPPELSQGAVQPQVGDTETEFEFSVRYYDDDGDAPTEVRVVIDGEPFDMSLASREPFSGLYVYNCQLAEGSHSFFFFCQDGQGGLGRFPEGDQIEGPTVVPFDDEPPYCIPVSPRPGDTSVDPNVQVSLKVLDDISGVDVSSIVLQVAGECVSPTILAISGGYLLMYQPPEPFAEGMLVSVDLFACDDALVPNCSDDCQYRFRVADRTPPVIIGRPIVPAVTPTSALVEWLTDEPADSLVDYGAVGEATVSTQSSVMRRLHAVWLVGLSPGSTYRFRVGSSDALGNGPTYSSWWTFVTPVRADTRPPSFVAGPAAAAISASAATIVWATDEPARGQIQYQAIRQGSSVAVEEHFRRRHIVLLDNLTPMTTYRCTVACRDLAGNVSRERTLQFETTSLPDTSAPTIVEGPQVIFLNDTLALVGCRTSELCSAVVEYGQTQGYGEEAAGPQPGLVHKVFLCGLEPGTEYHYRVLVTDLLGNGPTFSSDCTITTLSQHKSSGLFCTEGPDLGYVTDNAAKIEWETDEVGDTEVIFWEAGLKAPGKRVWRFFGSRRLHQAFLGGLKPGTTYNYIISSRGPAGSSLAGRKMGSITTLAEPDVSPPEISDIVCRYNAGGKIRIDWRTSEPGDSRIIYWPKHHKQVGKNSWAGSENKKEHSGWLSDIEIGTEYEYQVGSCDASGNTSWSATRTFTASGSADTVPPRFTSGPSVESSKGPRGVVIVWTTDEIADTVLNYYNKAEANPNMYHWASFEQTTDHRVELLGLAPGVYAFEAVSTDPAGNSSGVKRGSFVVSGSSSAPRLLNPHVEPTFGTGSTDFRYSVTYADPLGRAPSKAAVIIDGADVCLLSLTQGEPGNGLYATTRRLAPGVHNFAFNFGSASGDEVWAPQTGVYEGPTVAAVPRLSIGVKTDRPEYCRGDTQTLWLDASNTGDAYNVDLYVCVRVPGGGVLFWPGFTTEPTPIAILPFPAGSSFVDYQLFSMAIPEDVPLGDYVWYAALCEHNTLEMICDLAWSTFSIKPRAPELGIRINDINFVPGDEMVVELSAKNEGDALDVDLYLAVVLPDDTWLFWPAFSSLPYPTWVVLPGQYEITHYEVLRMTVPAGLPCGEYRWVAALLAHNTAEFLCGPEEVRFNLFAVRLDVSTNAESYLPGDTLTASMELLNFGDDIDLDLYAAVVLPDGSVLYLPSLDAVPAAYWRFRPLESGARYEGVVILQATLPGEIPAGSYCLLAGLFIPDTMLLYGKPAQTCWLFGQSSSATKP